jgi:hypothetical protein
MFDFQIRQHRGGKFKEAKDNGEGGTSRILIAKVSFNFLTWMEPWYCL